MAEVIGLVASIVTLCQVVGEGAKIVYKLYEAPDEIRQLQDQIEILENVIRLLKTTASQRSTGHQLQIPLSHTVTILGELSQAVHGNVLKGGDQSTPARRIRWLRNKGRVTSLCQRLYHSREGLLLALGSETLSSAQQIQSTLDHLSEQAANAQSSINYTLQTLTKFISKQQASHPFSSPPIDSDTKALGPSFFGKSGGLFNIAMDDGIHSTGLKFPRTDSAGVSSVASALELSPRFCPETYTNAPFSDLISYNSYRAETAWHSQTTNCSLLYSQSPRQWVRLTVSISLTLDTPYWRVGGGVGALRASPSVGPGLPNKLAAILLTFLRNTQNLHQHMHLNFLLKPSLNAEPTLSFCGPAVITDNYLREVMKSIRHLNCPRYFDRGLVKQTLNDGAPSSFFKVFLEGRWICGIQFGSTKAEVDAALHVLKVLNCLQNVPGICHLLGIVLDETGLISSFLIEMPARGYLADLCMAPNKEEPVSWERRERWCRQIISSVTEVHSRGLLVGFLAHLPTGVVAIDGNDNAVLFRWFDSMVWIRELPCGTIPPEYRGKFPMGSLVQTSPEADIFQLGLLLWRIVALEFTDHRGFCIAAGCNNAESACFDAHVDPVDLPPLEHCPRYLEEIIAACRRENPEDRPPARELLRMFKSHTVSGLDPITTTDDNDTALRFISTPEECDELYGNFCYCDICEARTDNLHFKCMTCMMGDFSLCPRCLAAGFHCLDPEHYLYGSSKEINEDRYYSRVKETGQRDIIVI
ncbi:hypothetical protein F5Y16DRAFT_369478 [Xylariaceae sp. FL0255]|nr:hypothetical protein F5Y16DRAFT_369478 [Xylariaceae sp. FL0255]